MYICTIYMYMISRILCYILNVYVADNFPRSMRPAEIKEEMIRDIAMIILVIIINHVQ